MSEFNHDQWIDLSIDNKTNVDLEINTVKLDWGKFYNHGGSKDDEVPRSDIEGRYVPHGSNRALVASCGRKGSPSGTQGSFYVYIRGTTTKVASVNWNCPYSGDNSFSAYSVNSKAGVKNTGWSKSGSLAYITVTIDGSL